MQYMVEFSKNGGIFLNIQEKKQFLQQYHTAEQEEQRLSSEITRWKLRTVETDEYYRNLPSTEDSSQELAGALCQINDLTRQLILQRSKLAALRQSVGAAIDEIQDTKLQELLRLRYIDGMTWERISEYMNYSYMQISRLHSKALSQLNM